MFLPNKIRLFAVNDVTVGKVGDLDYDNPFLEKRVVGTFRGK
jgi:hypothetical protein